MRKRKRKKIVNNANNKIPFAIILGAIIISATVYTSLNPSEKKKAYDRCLIAEGYHECYSNSCKRQVKKDCDWDWDRYLERY